MKKGLHYYVLWYSSVQAKIYQVVYFISLALISHPIVLVLVHLTLNSGFLRIQLKGKLRFSNGSPLEGAMHINLW